MEELAKDKWREGWIMINARQAEMYSSTPDPLMYTLTNGDKTVNIPYLTIAYGYRGGDIVKKELSEQGEKMLDKLGEEYDVSARTSWAMSEAEYEARESVILNLGEELVVKGFKIIIYIDGLECTFFEDEIKFLSDEEVADLLIGTSSETAVTNCDEFLPVIQQQSILQNKDFKDRLFYLSSRSVPKHIAIRYLYQTTKDSVYYIPFPKLLEIYFREDLTEYEKMFNQKVESI